MGKTERKKTCPDLASCPLKTVSYSVFHEAMARLPNVTAVRGTFTHSWLLAFPLIVGIIPVESHEAMCQGLSETVC